MSTNNKEYNTVILAGLQISLILVLVLSGFLSSLTSIAASEPGNDVWVAFNTNYDYSVNGNSYTCDALNPVAGNKSWDTILNNSPDNTGAPVTTPKATLAIHNPSSPYNKG